MNTKHLAGLYDTLSAAERLPLLLAAGARGDDVEVRRLLAAAGRIRVELPDTYGPVTALQHVTLVSRLHRLELAALAAGLAAAAGASTGERAERLGTVAHAYGYLLGQYAAGWRQFCASIGVDPAAADDGLPGEQIIATAAVVTEAATAADVLAWVRQHAPEVEGVAGADYYAARLGEAYRSLLEGWPTRGERPECTR